MSRRHDGAPVDWDAAAYQRLSTPQQAWANDVLGRLRLNGDEVVLDLGCGAGQVTEELVRLVPQGRVIGVDASQSMIDAASERLGAAVQLVVADLRTFVHADPVDLVFSTATLHWVPDHPALWKRIHAALRGGGRLEAQYGGAGNIEAVVIALPLTAAREPFASFLAPFATPWTFDAPEAALNDLEAAGFCQVRAWSQARTAQPIDARAFLANSIVPAELARLPAALRDAFVDSLFDALDRPKYYDYVRLNVSGVA
jgi:trans-aconitate 2-methyltransferase